MKHMLAGSLVLVLVCWCVHTSARTERMGSRRSAGTPPGGNPTNPNAGVNVDGSTAASGSDDTRLAGTGQSLAGAGASVHSKKVPAKPQPGADSAGVLSSEQNAPSVIITVEPAGERHPMLEALPPGKLMSTQELHNHQVGNGSPGVMPSPGGATVKPQANGIAGASYDDSRFGTSGAAYGALYKIYGKLYTQFGGNWYVCTASVIQRSLLVTAAHCIFNYGQGSNGWPDYDANGNLQVFFEPGKDGSSLPLGQWWAQGLLVPDVYATGTDTCCDVCTPHVVCNNDIALVWLKNNTQGQLLGSLTSYMAYGWNGYSFATPDSSWWFPSNATTNSLLTEIGYPVAFDSGNIAQVSNAAAYVFSNTYSSGALLNLVRGTAMTGGASGGPWIANMGTSAALEDVDYGVQDVRNVVMAVTSWGYGNSTVKMQGASWFGTNDQYPSDYGTRGAGNIAKLLYDACDNPAFPDWQLASKGLCD